ncbi:hypothetical protein [Streptomyces sp. SYSU K217416]
MRRRIVAAVSAAAAGLALGVLPASEAFASSDTRNTNRCSDWRGWDDRRYCDDRYYNDRYYNDRYYDDRHFRNFNDVVFILVAV